MGILRLGIIAAVGVALLPSDSEQQEILYNRAALAATWTMTFCDRNVQTCETASNLWGQFVKKAQFGARLAYDTVAEQLGSGDGSTDGQAAPVFFRNDGRTRGLETGTLKPGDLEPDWRGNGKKPAAKSTSRDRT